jgi:hypothetical protein
LPERVNQATQRRCSFKEMSSWNPGFIVTHDAPETSYFEKMCIESAYPEIDMFLYFRERTLFMKIKFDYQNSSILSMNVVQNNIEFREDYLTAIRLLLDERLLTTILQGQSNVIVYKISNLI